MTNYEQWAKDLPEITKDNYLAWLKSNLHGEMEDFGTYNIMFPMFKDDVLSRLNTALAIVSEALQKARGL
jgi:hypothetical protein